MLIHCSYNVHCCNNIESFFTALLANLVSVVLCSYFTLQNILLYNCCYEMFFNHKKFWFFTKNQYMIFTNHIRITEFLAQVYQCIKIKCYHSVYKVVVSSCHSTIINQNILTGVSGSTSMQ